jgi:Restriction endonuclease/EVE domain
MSAWLYQSNPQRYDVHAAIAENRQTWWNTPRYRDQIAVGDRAWLQIVGRDEPGIYYVATITSLPYERPDDEFGRWKVDMRFDYRVDPPLLRPELLADSQLAVFHGFRGFQGTNMLMPDEIAQRLAVVAEGRLEPLGDTPAPVGDDANVADAVDRHNRRVRQELKAAIRDMDPIQFELFVVRVLTALGYVVEHRGRTNDRGVDAEAVLSLEGLTSVTTKVQAKQWGHNVPGKVVRELRGALRVDERGLVVTTAEFTDEAIREAEAEGKARIGLLGGERLADLCVREGIGVDRRQIMLLEPNLSDLVAPTNDTGYQ